MMTHQTVDQLLQVFRIFRDRYEGGESLLKAYREAVRDVAQRHAVTYQTIGDGCRRRLMLDDIQELYDLLSAWIQGDPQPLRGQLRKASNPGTHDRIDAFFDAASVIERGASETNHPTFPPGGFVTFSFHLPERDARMLRALAEIEGVSTPKLLSDLVGSAVAEGMKRVAEAIVRESEVPTPGGKIGHDIIGILRSHEAELRRLGVEHVSLFGSAARGDWTLGSDIDLAVSLQPNASKGGFDYFGRMEVLRERLSEILNRTVDVIEEPAESTRLQDRIDGERIVAF